MSIKLEPSIEPTRIAVYREMAKILFDICRGMLITLLVGLSAGKLNIFNSLALALTALGFFCLGAICIDTIKNWEFFNAGKGNE